MNNRRRSVASITVLSAAHFLVDFICAMTMYNIILYGDKQADQILLYNFCAFALQMPFGLLADGLRRKRNDFVAFIMLALAAGFMALGLLKSAALLGIGNSLFHVAGGIIVIDQDDDAHLKGRGLGSFVAPGAIGLALGSLLKANALPVIIAALIGYTGLTAVLWIIRKEDDRFTERTLVLSLDREALTTVICCLAVVILRSYVGMSISFPWKNSVTVIMTSVLCVALGKMLGGFAAAELGMKKTVIITLLISACAYLLSGSIIFGHLALLMFNMTMPLTLYTLYRKMPSAPGFAFGILTFGLFVGVLPVALSMPAADYRLSGSVGSLISLILLLAAVRGDKGSE